MPFRLGVWELALILIIILVVFGVGKLTEVGGAMGRAMRAFRKAQSSEDIEKEERTPRKTVKPGGKSKA